MSIEEHSQSGSMESIKEVKTRSDAADRWHKELTLADKQEEDWRGAAKRIMRRYRAEERKAKDGLAKGDMRKHNILWANIETMKPAMYDSTPTPDVRRRYRDKDETAKKAAELIERALTFSVDEYDFDETMEAVVSDFLLVGRGIPRVNYVRIEDDGEVERVEFDPETEDVPLEAEFDDDGIPFIETEGQGDTHEAVIAEVVPWANFRRGPGIVWSQVPWIAFIHLMTRDELREKFGKEKADDITLDFKEDTEFSSKDITSIGDSDTFQRATIYEIWDKQKRQVIWKAKESENSTVGAILKIEDDPLNLSEFYPIPKPLYSLETTNSLVPSPDYLQYEDQALELDRVTNRINNLYEVLRFRGAYDDSIAGLAKILSLPDNEFMPVEVGTQILERGGLEKAIWTIPIEKIGEIIAGLFQQRQLILDTIFEITGISDILRGVSNSAETATAQNIKSQFGSLRLNRRQRMVQRMARDVMRIKAEIIAEKFSPENILMMANMQPEEVGEGVMELLKRDILRDFRIDIETDSTITKQLTQDKQAIGELMGGISNFVQAIQPLVATGFFDPVIAMSMLQTVLRRADFGREVESLIDASIQKMVEAQQQPKQPDPAQIEQKMEVEKKQLEVEGKEIDNQKKQVELQIKQAEAQIKPADMLARIAGGR